MVERSVVGPEEQRERLFLARGTALGMQLVAGLLLLNALIGPLSFFLATGQLRLSPALLGGLVGVMVLALVQVARVKQAMVVFIWGGTIIPIWGLLRGYGLLDGNLLFLPVAAMGAGFMLGTRHAVAVTATVFCAVFGVLAMELTGSGFSPRRRRLASPTPSARRSPCCWAPSSARAALAPTATSTTRRSSFRVTSSSR